MCAACVAQGVGYVGTALVGLQVMGARAKVKRRRSAGSTEVESGGSSGGVEAAEAGAEAEQPAGV